MSDKYLYSHMQAQRLPLETLLGSPEHFVPVPANWLIVVVDIEDSTQAVKNGLHQEVNLVAAGAIIAVQNELKKLDDQLNIPYFFGGDGATFLLPPEVSGRLLEILDSYRHHVRRNLFLSLRVGSRPVGLVYENGRQIKLAKFAVNEVLTIPIVLGMGLKRAERVIKGYFLDETVTPDTLTPVNLDGMECRWEEIEPPEEEDKIMCLVVECIDEDLQPKVYQELVQHINTYFGGMLKRQPISTHKLKLDLALFRIRQEMKSRIGKFDLMYLLKNWMITIAGKFYFLYFKEGKAYLEKVSQLSYTIMIDGTFNCVLSGKPSEIAALVEYLDAQEQLNRLKFGVQITYASVLSCYIEDRLTKHLHFVDGTDGGYTTAARMFKAKLAEEDNLF